MSCDVHMFAEVQKDGRWEGRWEKVGDVFRNPYYEPDKPDSDWNRPTTDACYPGRNYDLFAMLADVRNGWGFADVPTARAFEPIAWPRGVPEDASPEYRAYAEGYKEIYPCHSHSWLTLEELLAYDWHGQVALLYQDLFVEDDFLRQRRGLDRARPAHAADFRGAEVLTQDEYEVMLRNGSRDSTRRYVICEPHLATYYECAREFVDETLPELAKLGDPQDVRIVFFFDN